MKAAGGAAYLAQLARGIGPCHRCRRVRPDRPRPLPAPAADRSRRGRGQRRLQADARGDRPGADRGRRKEALRPRQRRPDRRRLQAVPRRPDGGDGRRRGGLPPRRPAHRRGLRPVPARPAAGRPASVGPDHPRRPSLRWERPRSPPTSRFNAAKAYREEHRRRRKPKAVDGAVVGFFSLEMSAEQLATRMLSEQAEIPSREDPQGRADQRRLRQGADRSASELEHLQLLHRRHAGADASPPCAPAPAG